MRTMILGKTGKGKTTLARSLLRDFQGIKRILVYDFMGEYDGDITVHTLQELYNACLDPTKHTILVREYQGSFDTLCEFVYDLGNCVFLVEEIDSASSAVSVPQYLSFLYRYGRHRNIDMFAVSRRPAEVPRIVTAMSNIYYIFSITEPRDIMYLNQLQVGLGDRAKRLEQFEYITLWI